MPCVVAADCPAGSTEDPNAADGDIELDGAASPRAPPLLAAVVALLEEHLYPLHATTKAGDVVRPLTT